MQHTPVASLPQLPAQPLRVPAQLAFWGAGDAVLGCKTISAFLLGETEQVGNSQGSWFFTCGCPWQKHLQEFVLQFWVYNQSLRLYCRS